MNTKQPGRPATGKGAPVMVRIQPDLLSKLEKAAADMGETSTPEAIRRMLRDWLTSHGY